MKNPYEVLEVSQNASEEEIKEAYKKLVKKYHPDKYQDNPLADLAEEKLREVNQAYDEIMAGRVGGSGSYGGGYSGAGSSGSYGSSDVSQRYREIRIMLDRDQVVEASSMLNNMGSRDAEWYFLSGVASWKKGWYDDALVKIQQAAAMEPGNLEYRQALQSLGGAANMYGNSPFAGRGRYGDGMLCRLCEMYICLDCLCGN